MSISFPTYSCRDCPYPLGENFDQRLYEFVPLHVEDKGLHVRQILLTLRIIPLEIGGISIEAASGLFVA